MQKAAIDLIIDNLPASAFAVSLQLVVTAKITIKHFTANFLHRQQDFLPRNEEKFLCR